MNPNLYYSKKIRFTFLSVFFTCVIFANTGVPRLFIKKWVQVAGLDQVFISLLKTVNQGGFYVVEKTVFHADTFTTAKVVYISNSKELAKNEKIITSFREEKNFSKERDRSIKRGIPFNGLPFRGGCFRFYNQYWAFVWGQTLANKNVAFSKKNSIYNNNTASNTFFIAPCKTLLNSFANTTKINNLYFLDSYHCRPPPVA